jgi:hypothetical protein
MKFIDKGKTVQIQIAERIPKMVIHADFEIAKENFEDFLDHVIQECKAAYKRDGLFPPIKREDIEDGPFIPPPLNPPGGSQ